MARDGFWAFVVGFAASVSLMNVGDLPDSGVIRIAIGVAVGALFACFPVRGR